MLYRSRGWVGDKITVCDVLNESATTCCANSIVLYEARHTSPSPGPIYSIYTAEPIFFQFSKHYQPSLICAFSHAKKSCSDVQECWQAVSIERGSNLFIWSIFSFQVNVVWRAKKCLAQSFCCPHPITTSLAYWPTQRNYCLPMSCDKGEASLMVHFAHCDLNLPFAPHCLPKSGTKSLCALNSFN